jgi:hypothetical protein
MISVQFFSTVNGVYMLCMVTVVRVHLLYCDNGTCTCFDLVAVMRVHVLYRDSGACTCCVW